MNRIWNKKLLGSMGMIFSIISIVFHRVYDSLFTFIYTKNLKNCGKDVYIQHSSIFRNVDKITLKDGVFIGRNVLFSSELDGELIIGEYTQINKECHIDFSGTLVIGSSCTISENVMIQTHDHGLNPRSRPMKSSLVVEDNVWIGTRATILHNVNKIGKNSIIAACAVVTKDVPPNVVVGGNPAVVIKELHEK